MMSTSTKMFVEQSHLSMPPSVWLHVSGVSLTTDIHPYQPPPPPIHAYDYRTKHLQSPVQPVTSPLIQTPTVLPYSITMIDGPFNNNMNKQYQKLGNTDMPKKFFIDRQIKKAKSLPGLIKGTALSRQTPLQSGTFTSPAPPNPSVNNSQDDPYTSIVGDNEDDSLPLPTAIDRQHETRRPRVNFSDFNNIQFIEDNKEISQQQIPINYSNRPQRRRPTKKSSSINHTNGVLPPSIQQPQTLHNFPRPLSRQQYHQVGQELSIKKQQLLASPRTHSSRLTHFPDILNQSLLTEPVSSETTYGKFTLQREKPLNRVPKPATDTPTIETSNENTRNDVIRSSLIQDSNTHEPQLGDTNNGILLHGSSILSSSSTNRQRSSLRTISLRQQFISPIKIKATGISNNQQMTARRSTSLKQSATGLHDENEDLRPNGTLLTVENRPMTGLGSTKKLKRSYAIHVNPKNSLGGNPTTDLNETHRHSVRSYFPDSTQERFQNLLSIVRPPYATGNGGTTNGPLIAVNDSTKHTTAGTRSSRHPNTHGPLEYHITSNTIFV